MLKDFHPPKAILFKVSMSWDFTEYIKVLAGAAEIIKQKKSPSLPVPREVVNRTLFFSVDKDVFGGRWKLSKDSYSNTLFMLEPLPHP